MFGCSRCARICRSWRNRATAELALELELERLDRDFLVELVVVADGEIDRAHAAVTERAHDPIRTRSGGPPRCRRWRRPMRPRLSTTTRSDRSCRRETPPADSRRSSSSPAQRSSMKRARRRGIQRGGGVVQRLEPAKPFGIHAPGEALSAERSQTMPRRTSFSTVLTLMSRTSAISAISSPPKYFNSIARALRGIDRRQPLERLVERQQIDRSRIASPPARRRARSASRRRRAWRRGGGARGRRGSDA